MQIKTNVAHKLASAINDYNFINQGALGNIHAEAADGVVGLLTFNENELVEVSSEAEDGGNDNTQGTTDEQAALKFSYLTTN